VYSLLLPEKVVYLLSNQANPFNIELY